MKTYNLSNVHYSIGNTALTMRNKETKEVSVHSYSRIGHIKFKNNRIITNEFEVISNNNKSTKILFSLLFKKKI